VCFGILCSGGFCGCINKHTFCILTKPCVSGALTKDWFVFMPSSMEQNTASGIGNRLGGMELGLALALLSWGQAWLLIWGFLGLEPGVGRGGEGSGRGPPSSAADLPACWSLGPSGSGSPGSPAAATVCGKGGSFMCGGVALAGKIRDFARKYECFVKCHAGSSSQEEISRSCLQICAKYKLVLLARQVEGNTYFRIF